MQYVSYNSDTDRRLSGVSPSSQPDIFLLRCVRCTTTTDARFHIVGLQPAHFTNLFCYEYCKVAVVKPSTYVCIHDDAMMILVPEFLFQHFDLVQAKRVCVSACVSVGRSVCLFGEIFIIFRKQTIRQPQNRELNSPESKMWNSIEMWRMNETHRSTFGRKPNTSNIDIHVYRYR